MPQQTQREKHYAVLDVLSRSFVKSGDQWLFRLKGRAEAEQQYEHERTEGGAFLIVEFEDRPSSPAAALGEIELPQGTTVVVYQLDRGRGESAVMAAANHIYQEFESGRRAVVARAEFDRFWDLSGVEYFAHKDEKALLGGIWERWNSGSGVESKAFRRAKTRSLSIGDIVQFDGSYYVCLPFGWNEVDLESGEVLRSPV